MSPTARKTALVTGAGARIGRAFAIRLAAMGYSVAVHYRRSRDGAEETVAAISETGGRAAKIRADFGPNTDFEAVIAAAERELGAPVTLLLNNAATFVPDSAIDHTRLQWDAHMEPNLWAPVALARAFAQRLPEAADGLVVNLVDQRVCRPDPGYFTYSLSKNALWTATGLLARALAPKIRVNALSPGAILPADHETDADFGQLRSAQPIPRTPTTDDLCDALAYLVGAESVTGQMLVIDSGLHLAVAGPTPEGARIAHPPASAHAGSQALTLTVSGLEIAVEIGVYPSEKGRKQPLICDLEIAVDSREAPASLAQTVDYAAVCDMARDLAAKCSFTLLEHFVNALAERIAEKPNVREVTVHAVKPGARDMIGGVPGARACRAGLAHRPAIGGTTSPST